MIYGALGTRLFLLDTVLYLLVLPLLVLFLSIPVSRSHRLVSRSFVDLPQCRLRCRLGRDGGRSRCAFGSTSTIVRLVQSQTVELGLAEPLVDLVMNVAEP